MFTYLVLVLPATNSSIFLHEGAIMVEAYLCVLTLQYILNISLISLLCHVGRLHRKAKVKMCCFDCKLFWTSPITFGMLKLCCVLEAGPASSHCLFLMGSSTWGLFPFCTR